MDKNSHRTIEQLSAFFDGELASGEAVIVEQHVADCADCLRELSAMERTRRSVQMLAAPSAPDAIWDRIEGALPRKARVIPIFGPPVARWSAVAAFLAAIGIGTLLVNPFGLMPASGPPISHLDDAGFDYGLYLLALTEPDRMEQFEARYDRRKASLQEALAAVGTPVDRSSLRGVPDGFELTSVYVLSNASTRSMQVTYRHKGSEITVFRQPKNHPVHFADYQLEPAMIGGNRCLMAHEGRYCAITIATNDAQYVVIGHRDDVMVAELLNDLVSE